MPKRVAKGRSMFVTALLVGACVLPTALAARRAMGDADDDSEQPSDEPAARAAKTAAKGKGDKSARAGTGSDDATKRREVLAAMRADETALINVTEREMPASPDILNLGRKASRPLARCVSDNVDDALRAACASLLGRMGDRAGLSALQGALEAWDAGVRRAAIDALAKMPDRSSTMPLAKILEREDEEATNRAAALEALGAMADTRALPILARALRSGDDATIRAAAFRGLWKSRHLAGRPQLVAWIKAALDSDENELMLPGTFAASELRATELTSSLERLIEAKDARIRNRAVYALGKIGNRSATRTLRVELPKVRESRMLNNIAFALERLDPTAFYAAADGLASHKQAQIRMNAAFVLGDVRRPEALPFLARALDDPNESVKLSAVIAIGKLDAPDGAKLLERFVDDRDPSLSRAAIYALYALSGDTRTDLVHDKLFANPARPGDRLDAAIALGRAHDARAVPDLALCLEQRTCRIDDVEAPLLASRSPEVSGRALLAWVRGRRDASDLVARMRPPAGGVLVVSEAQAAIAQRSFGRAADALDLAGDLADADAVRVLRPLLDHDDARVRLHAAVALARAGVTEADARIFAELDAMPHDRLPRAGRLLGRVSEPAARARLLPELVRREKSDDVDVAIACAAAHFAWDPEGAFFRMLDALASTSRRERDLAERWLAADPRPVVTELLRRALARERRAGVEPELRRLLDLRAK